jgi:hypothetical protein
LTETPTAREALLEARIRELENAQKKAAISTAQGGMFEGLWRAVNKVIPSWLAVAALAVVFVHYGLAYYVGIQIAQAETAFKSANADVEKGKADAVNASDIDGLRLRLKQIQQELRLKQAQAAQAQVNADAQIATFNGESTQLSTLLAQLSLTRNQASLARAKADAESARFGVQTLEQRAVSVKVALEKQAIITSKAKAAVLEITGSKEDSYLAYVHAECEDNEFAAAIGCPEQYIRRTSPAPAPPSPSKKRVGTVNKR